MAHPCLALHAHLENLLGPEGASRFNEDDLRALWAGGYTELSDLKNATQTGLQRAELRPARADQLIRAQDAATSTSAPTAKQQGAAAPTNTLRKVARLLHGEKTVGSSCLVASHDGTLYVVTARHCLLPSPGQRIGDLGLTAFGHKLCHVASFPVDDITVLRFELSDGGGADLVGITPFTLATGLGVSLNTRVMMLGFPSAADQDVKGLITSKIPVQSSGVISWLSPDLNEAMADYPGALPNCSGGAVVLQDGWELAGVHLGTLYHEAGERPGGDVQPEGGDQQGGATGGGGLEPMEIDVWACDRSQAAKAADATKKRPLGGDSGRFPVIPWVKFNAANIPEKACLARFVPAHRLLSLLRLALGTTGADSQGGASH